MITYIILPSEAKTVYINNLIYISNLIEIKNLGRLLVRNKKMYYSKYSTNYITQDKYGGVTLLEEDFSKLVNYLWKESMKNLNSVLTEQEVGKFCSNDYYYLSTIHELKRPNFTMIAEELNVSKPAVSAIIRKLLSMGLVKKERCEQDKRVMYVTVTEKGLRIIKGDHELYKGLSSQIKALVNNERELLVIYKIIHKLAKSIAT